ncbi:MAG: TIGR03435 family protein [Bryobacteraceae bacterium]|jgi:uncharacterized protein (TIGR03435 family)
MKIGFLIALLLTVLVAARPLGAQTDDSKITFEVASVKPAGPFVPGAGRGNGTYDPGRFTLPRATLSDLLTMAYDVPADQISGPAWLSERGTYVYSIAAIMPPDTTKDKFRLMLQNLLAERFHVILHHEAQPRPGYELVVAKEGPRLKEWVPSTDAAPFKPGRDANGFPKLAPGAAAAGGVTFNTSGRPAVYRMAFRETIAAFCLRLGAFITQSNGAPMGSPQPRVVDRTGLAGTYEFTLEFADAMPPAAAATPPAPAADNAGMPMASVPGEGFPNIFTAVEKQLGLHLVKVRSVSVDVLIVDRADKVPSEN